VFNSNKEEEGLECLRRSFAAAACAFVGGHRPPCWRGRAGGGWNQTAKVIMSPKYQPWVGCLFWVRRKRARVKAALAVKL